MLGRPVVVLEADDASNPDIAVKAATKFIKEDRVPVLMGTSSGDRAFAVSTLAQGADRDHFESLRVGSCERAAGLRQARVGKGENRSGGLIGGEQIGRPLGYAGNAGIWCLIWGL